MLNQQEGAGCSASAAEASTGAVGVATASFGQAKASADTGTGADAVGGVGAGAYPGFSLGSIRVWTPLVLAPMAGVTDQSFRRLCRRFAELALVGGATADSQDSHSENLYSIPTLSENQNFPVAQPKVDAPGGLYVSEMVTAKAICERNRTSLAMVRADPAERVRSIQLYGVNSQALAEATRYLLERDLADHIDLNFGCPVPKVMRRGGGSAVPWKVDLFREIVTAVVGAAREIRGEEVPVTIKMRIGIDDDHITVFDAAQIAEEAGIAAIGLHARTAAQYYSGEARWEWIAELKRRVGIPVLGNGDVFSGEDAKRLLAETGCDGVTVGRGCQGRPWLFAQLAAALTGKSTPLDPNLRQVADIITLHATWMVEDLGDETLALRHMRKHIGWYLRGFAVGGEMRGKLSLVKTLAELRELLEQLDLEQEFPASSTGRRGRAGNERVPHLPQGWLDSRTLDPKDRQNLHLAEEGGSGG